VEEYAVDEVEKGSRVDMEVELETRGKGEGFTGVAGVGSLLYRWLLIVSELFSLPCPNTRLQYFAPFSPHVFLFFSYLFLSLFIPLDNQFIDPDFNKLDMIVRYHHNHHQILKF